MNRIMYVDYCYQFKSISAEMDVRTNYANNFLFTKTTKCLSLFLFFFSIQKQFSENICINYCLDSSQYSLEQNQDVMCKYVVVRVKLITLSKCFQHMLPLFLCIILLHKNKKSLYLMTSCWHKSRIYITECIMIKRCIHYLSRCIHDECVM